MIRVLEDFPYGTAKSVCYLCRTGVKSVDGVDCRAVMTGAKITREGELALCEVCVVLLGQEVGMLPAAEAFALTEANALLRARLSEASAELATVDDRMADLDVRDAALAEREELLGRLLARVPEQASTSDPLDVALDAVEKKVTGRGR